MGEFRDPLARAAAKREPATALEALMEIRRQLTPFPTAGAPQAGAVVMATLEQQRAWLDDLFKHGDRTSDFQAARVEALIRSLQFHGARVAEPRGLSDTGLDDHHLRRALEFGVSDRLAEEILAHLDRYGRFLDAAEKLYEAERTETVEESGPVSLVSRTLTDGSVAYDVHLLCAEGSGQAPQGRPDLRLVFPCETEIAALDLFDALRDAPRAEVHRIDGETGQGGAQ